MEIRVIVILKNFRYFLRFTDADFFCVAIGAALSVEMACNWKNASLNPGSGRTVP